jgi:two-component system, OmpR family, response regulator QseB
MRALLVEDDFDLGDSLRTGLIQSGYAVDWLKDGIAADQALKVEEFDVIVLDLDIPRMSGLQVLRNFRIRKKTTPVLILTAKESIHDRVHGLDAGADDYMVKPCDLYELCARLRALHRRSQERAISVIQYGGITIDPAAHTVTNEGVLVNIARREFSLLQKLLENAGKALSRDQLNQSLYSWDDEVDSNALEVHVHNLRKKFGADIIRTIRGVGYMVDKKAPSN